MSPEMRVGLVTLLALALFIGLVAFLRGGALRGPEGYALHVVMRDASGLEPGTPVRLSGVTVGQVAAVDLTPQHLARVTLRIRRDVSIPRGSRFQPATPGLVGERSLAVTPPAQAAPPLPAGATVPGEEPYSLERIGRRLEAVADRITILVDNANALLADPQLRADLRQTLRSAREAAALARETVAQARLVAASARRAGTDVEAAAARVRQVVDVDVAEISADLRAMAENLEAASTRVRTIVDETAGEGRLARDIRETASSLREAGQRIREMAEDLQGFVNEEQVAKVRAIVEEAQAGVREARAVIRRAGGALDRVGGGAGRLHTLTYDVWYGPGGGSHALDLTLFPGAARSYRLGLRDIGGDGGLVLQVGGRLTDALRWRAGVYDSQVGVGLDYRMAAPFTISLDAYDLNRPTIDALARYQLTPVWGLTFVGRDVLRTPVWLLGVGTTF